MELAESTETNIVHIKQEIIEGQQEDAAETVAATVVEQHGTTQIDESLLPTVVIDLTDDEPLINLDDDDEDDDANDDNNHDKKNNINSKSVVSSSAEDATLILSAAEENDFCSIEESNNGGDNNKMTETTEEVVVPKEKIKDQASSIIKEKQPSSPILTQSRNIWISNISHDTKAVDLKKIFANVNHLKVVAAKVVTNGRSFFGYITMETMEMTQESISLFNGTTLNGKTIALSMSKPCGSVKKGNMSPLQQSSAAPKQAKQEQRQIIINNNKNDRKKKSSPTSTKFVAGKTDNRDNKKANSKDKNARNEQKSEKNKENTTESLKIKSKTIDSLKKTISNLESDYRQTKKRLNDAYKLLDTERAEKAKLQRELSKIHMRMDRENRKRKDENERMLKKIKLDEICCEEERNSLKKELEECRKLRDYIQENISIVRKSPIKGNRSRRSISPKRTRGINQRARSRSPQRRQLHSTVVRPHTFNITKLSKSFNCISKNSTYNNKKELSRSYGSSKALSPNYISTSRDSYWNNTNNNSCFSYPDYPLKYEMPVGDDNNYSNTYPFSITNNDSNSRSSNWTSSVPPTDHFNNYNNYSRKY